MNVGEMYEYISFLVDDINFGYFTKPQLLRFINQATQECQKKLLAAGQNWYLKVDQTATTVANQKLYTPPTDLMDLNRLELVQNPGPNEVRITLTSITLNQQDGFANVVATPNCFYFQKNQIALVPTPDNSIYTIRYYYSYRVPAVAAESDVVDVPEEFHEYICNLAALKCFIKDGRDASLLMRVIDDVEKRLEKQAIQRAQDRASTVVMMMDDSFGPSY